MIWILKWMMTTWKFGEENAVANGGFGMQIGIEIARKFNVEHIDDIQEEEVLQMTFDIVEDVKSFYNI